MNIPAPRLKSVLKRLSASKSESFQFGEFASAQDSDLWIITENPLSGLGDFSVRDGKKFSAAVNRTGGNLEIDKQEKFLYLKSAKTKFELETQNTKPVKFPTPPDKFVTVPLSDFKKVLVQAATVASPKKSAGAGGGVYGGVVQVKSLPLGIEDQSPKGYKIIGADEFVLTSISQITSVPFEFKFSLNLAAAAAIQIMDGETLEFGETTNGIWFKAGGTTIIASKRDESRPEYCYPKYDGLFAQTPKLRIGFNPENWLSAIKNTEILSEDGEITLLLKDGVVVFSSVGVGNTAQDEAEYEQIEPDIFTPITVSNLRLNAKNLSGFLSKASEETFMNLVDKQNPIRLESGNVQTLVMPITGGKK